MKKNLKIEYIFSGLILLLYAYKLFKINTGLDSLYDEGHLLIRLWQVRHGIIHEGISQWPVMIYNFFGEKFSSSRWRSAKPGRGNGRFENARIFYRKYGKNTCKSIAKGV